MSEAAPVFRRALAVTEKYVGANHVQNAATLNNLAEILEKAAHIIRDRFRLKRQIRVHTAQGRLTGWILAILPVVLGLGLYLVNPENMSLLWKRLDGTDSTVHRVQFYVTPAGSSPDRGSCVLAGLILASAAVMVSRFKADDCIYKGLSLKETRICQPPKSRKLSSSPRIESTTSIPDRQKCRSHSSRTASPTSPSTSRPTRRIITAAAV